MYLIHISRKAVLTFAVIAMIAMAATLAAQDEACSGELNAVDSDLIQAPADMGR